MSYKEPRVLWVHLINALSSNLKHTQNLKIGRILVGIHPPCAMKESNHPCIHPALPWEYKRGEDVVPALKETHVGTPFTAAPSIRQVRSAGKELHSPSPGMGLPGVLFVLGEGECRQEEKALQVGGACRAPGQSVTFWSGGGTG